MLTDLVVTAFTWNIVHSSLYPCTVTVYGNSGKVNFFLCLISLIKQKLQCYPLSGMCIQGCRGVQNKCYLEQ